jgi:hypothetical protein
MSIDSYRKITNERLAAIEKARKAVTRVNNLYWSTFGLACWMLGIETTVVVEPFEGIRATKHGMVKASKIRGTTASKIIIDDHINLTTPKKSR